MSASPSATAERSSSPDRSDSALAGFFSLGDTTPALQAAEATLRLLGKPEGEAERAALKVIGAVLDRSGVPESGRLSILAALSGMPATDLARASFAILDGSVVVCSDGRGARAWQLTTGESLPEETYRRLRPLVTTVFHVGQFFQRARQFYAA